MFSIEVGISLYTSLTVLISIAVDAKDDNIPSLLPDIKEEALNTLSITDAVHLITDPQNF